MLMVGADENVDGVPLDLHDNIDDRDGAGELSVARTLFVSHAAFRRNGGNPPVVQGHDYGNISSSSTPSNSFYAEEYFAKTSARGQRLRVALAWDATATCTAPDTDSGSCTGSILDADMDLYVTRESDGLTVASYTADNSYEFLDIPVVAGEVYRIRIYVYSWNTSFTYWGLSWLIWPFSTT